jgi:predicted transcriptional regulator
VSHLIFVAARLELADQLKDGPRTAEELARAVQVQAPGLYRLLRALASVDVFAEACQFWLAGERQVPA